MRAAAGAARRHGPLPVPAASCYGSTEMSYIGQVQGSACSLVPIRAGGRVAVLFFVAFSFFTRTVLATMPPIILSLVRV